MADALKRITGAHAFLKAVRATLPSVSLEAAEILLLVAHRPGLGMREIGEACGLSHATNSRLIAQLSEWQAFDKRGLGLIRAVEDPQERRRKIVSLTEQGQTTVARLLKPLA